MRASLGEAWRRQQVALNGTARLFISLWRVNQCRALPASNQVQDIKQQQQLWQQQHLAFPLNDTKASSISRL